MDITVTFLLLVLAGIGIGMLSGLLGIGGGTLMVPLFRLGFGLDAFMATATSLFAIIPISLAGAITHIRGRTCIPKLGLLMGVAGALTSSLGVYLGSISPAWLIMVVAAIIIVYSAYNILKKAINPANGKRAEEKAPQADTVHEGSDPHTFKFSSKSALLAIAIGLVAGLASGYVGVGGGFIMVPFMMAWLRVPMKLTSGTSLIAIIVLGIPGVVQQIMLGHVDFLVGIAVCVGAIPGAVLGAWLVPRVPERVLRFIFAGLLFVSAILLVVKEFGLM